MTVVDALVVKHLHCLTAEALLMVFLRAQLLYGLAWSGRQRASGGVTAGFDPRNVMRNPYASTASRRCTPHFSWSILSHPTRKQLPSALWAVRESVCPFPWWVSRDQAYAFLSALKYFSLYSNRRFFFYILVAFG